MIELINVSKHFGAVTALQDLTLTLGRGEFVLCTGPSGAGKSTLLRLLVAADRPDQGVVRIAGQDIGRFTSQSIAKLRRSIGFVFQDFKLISRRTAYENVALALELRGVPAREVRDRSVAALEMLGCKDRLHTKVHRLSGGEQQRVAIARAIVVAPDIFLADEPTSNLDPELTHDVLDLFELTAKSGTTVIVATHDPFVIEGAAWTRTLLLEQGRLMGAYSGSHLSLSPAAPSRQLPLEHEPIGALA